MGLAAHFRIWDIPKWLSEISWDQLEEWLEFDPIGEERADLRIGALATVLLNTSDIDHDKIGGLIKPRGYIAGWSKDLEYTLTPMPKELKEELAKKSESESVLNLSDPIGWENFATKLIKYVGVEK